MNIMPSEVQESKSRLDMRIMYSEWMEGLLTGFVH